MQTHKFVRYLADVDKTGSDARIAKRLDFNFTSALCWQQLQLKMFEK